MRLAVSAAGALSPDTAILASLAYGIALLFAVSFFLALHHGRRFAVAILYGAGGAILGGVVVSLELLLH